MACRLAGEAIICSNAGTLLIRLLGTDVYEIEMYTFL